MTSFDIIQNMSNLGLKTRCKKCKSSLSCVIYRSPCYGYYIVEVDLCEKCLLSTEHLINQLPPYAVIMVTTKEDKKFYKIMGPFGYTENCNIQQALHEFLMKCKHDE